MKLLLTSVFGPYGVDDQYGEKENKMELFQQASHECSLAARLRHSDNGRGVCKQMQR